MRKASALAVGEITRTAPAGSHRLRQIRIIGGFLDGAEFELAEGLNCLIGARGTGKTTVLELVRFALHGLPDDADERRRVESVVRSNLRDGRVELAIETKEGLTYTVSRAADEEPLVLTPDGSPTEITLRGGGVFKADVYSQNQIERIADQALSQLSIIDNFEAARIAQINADIHAVESKLATNAGAIAPLQGQIDALADEIAGLPAVEHKLKALPPVAGENAAAVERAQAAKSLRHREAQAIQGVWQFLPEYDSQLEALQGQLAGQTKQLFVREVMEGPNSVLMNPARQAMLECASAIDDLLSAARNQISKTQEKIGEFGTALTAAHAQQDVAFRTMIEKDQALRGQASERANLERLKNDILAKRRQRDALVAKLAAIQKERTTLFDRLSELRDQRYRIREQVARRINTALHPTIRVRIEQSGHLEEYRSLLEEALRGVRIKQGIVAQKIIEKLLPPELVGIVRERNSTSLKRRVGLNDEQADKIIDALADANILFALEVIEMPDKPIIELKDGDAYKPSSELSTGQKCTTILPILLLDSKNPLLIDQPEDNLDNRFVCESVVESIRHVKEHRQLIFVTHNPNIPVLGDAERVFVLESDGTHACKVAEGDVDGCRDAIVNLLEGGEQAFRQRQERYAYA